MKHFIWSVAMAVGWSIGCYITPLLGVTDAANYNSVIDVFMVCLIAKYSMPKRN